MIADTEIVVTHLTGQVQRAGQVRVKASQPIGPRPAASSRHWYPGAAMFSRSYVVAGLRAGLIALVLLAVLAVVVLY